MRDEAQGLSPVEVSTPAPERGSRTVPPVFVGGTGRSGTTILGRLIGSHPDYALIPIEAHFHAYPKGVPGLVSGEVTVMEFLDFIDARWSVDVGRRGRLGKLVGRLKLERILDDFAQRYQVDPTAAARELVEAIFGGFADRSGRPGWVEMTPGNAGAAATLTALFPEGKVVHIVRDGRDVACSRLAKNREPPEKILAWLEFWERILTSTDLACRGLPDSQVLLLGFEDLVVHHRKRSYRLLQDFIGMDDASEMRDFFEEELRPDRANVGRWRHDLPEDLQETLVEAYKRSIRRMSDRKVDPALVRYLKRTIVENGRLSDSGQANRD